ncbi:MAG TPA: PaaI family thioesterase [Longimicrobium sp.]|nr:PaaI family thioesterase [Longimicrobium sp.]
MHTLLPAGVGYTSVDLSIKFLRPVTLETGRIRAEARVINAGSRTALAEARLVDGRGKLLAYATSTCMILRPEGRA